MPSTKSDAAVQHDSAGFLASLSKAVQSLQLSGARILVGISGGADSVALLRGLAALADRDALQVVATHLNHGLRPGAAEDDADWTAELCRRYEIPIVVEALDVLGYANERRLNLEEAARALRYQFFDRAARAQRCTHVAVAHTADDQVETVLHHLFRGTGLAGLRGMQPARPLAPDLTLVRPLLAIPRRQLAAWLAEIGQDFRTDATNADQSRMRSRIRHSVLPALERDLGPQIRDSLLRISEQAGELQATIEELADELLRSCLADETAELVRLNVEPLADRPRHLVREVFVSLWKRKNWPRQAVGFDDWDRLARLATEGGSATLPGRIEATRRGKLIVIRGSSAGS
jgi:tRNA(Ile)-lysidine synthase